MFIKSNHHTRCGIVCNKTVEDGSSIDSPGQRESDEENAGWNQDARRPEEAYGQEDKAKENEAGESIDEKPIRDDVVVGTFAFRRKSEGET